MTDNKTCPECNKEFSSNYGMKIHYGKKHKGSLAGVVTTCENCETEYRTTKNNYKKRDMDFCSRDCYSEWLSKNKSADENPNYNSVKIKCEYCNSNIQKQPNELERNEKSFCDKNCYSSWQSENMKGENNHNYNPNYTEEYGDNWSKIREFILERDYYRCRSCKITNEKHKQNKGIGLDVHHKIPLRKFDTPEKANRPYNLITLCRKCHRKVESNTIIT